MRRWKDNTHARSYLIQRSTLKQNLMSGHVEINRIGYRIYRESTIQNRFDQNYYSTLNNPSIS